ncbi:MAG TPA: HAD family hydrolase [Aggregatilinea sp.]|jgi:putative hydrolase of the HAD superfamily|uniref:HAD family hydrolase n=1 Tax=Aggregatilinea sp. TaxID=2806333 RepID=UPI002CFE2747|nr:HAD family hydrolase [Aggregatilinea sp.]HML20385.1 HAD family hydrolase [Aggregatilinea sp.]
MSLRGVIFDMGGTLLHFNPEGTSWEESEKIATGAVYNYLRTLEYTLLPEQEALDAAWEVTRNTWAGIEHADVKSLKLDMVLGTIAQGWGAADLPGDVYQDMAAAYMSAIQPHVRPLDGVYEMLDALRDDGMRLALISNTFWPGSVHVQDLERFGLTQYFERLIFSADAEAWKPNSDVFLQALDALDLAPDEAAYVGDSLYFDVWGSKQAGLRGVWIEQPDPWLPEGIEVTPDATIRTLPELPAIARDWAAVPDAPQVGKRG